MAGHGAGRGHRSARAANGDGNGDGDDNGDGDANTKHLGQFTNPRTRPSNPSPPRPRLETAILRCMLALGAVVSSESRAILG